MPELEPGESGVTIPTPHHAIPVPCVPTITLFFHARGLGYAWYRRCSLPRKKTEKTYKIWKKGKIIVSSTPGKFAGIVTQKIFGRLDCWSGKRALKKNRVFFHTWEDAIASGMRPCKHCKPVP